MDENMSLEEKLEQMLPHTSDVAKNLIEQIQQEEREAEIERSASWIEDIGDINFWEFRNKNYTIIREFETWMDILEPGWEELGVKLGLEYVDIQHCRLYCGESGPTKRLFSLLEERKEYRDLTLQDILNIVKELERFDLLTIAKWRKGIEKIQANEEATTLHKPHAAKTITLNIQARSETLVCSANEGSVPKQALQSRRLNSSGLKAKILLVFASDAKPEALQVAELLRNPQSNKEKIGVLLLVGDVKRQVAIDLRTDPGSSIYKWYKQVNFVVPVLSPQFLRQIQNRDITGDDVNEKFYNRYVYRLMLDHYIENGCRNIKCRALCPAKYNNEVVSNELVKGNGLLQIQWNCSSPKKIEEFAATIILGEVGN